MKDKMIRSKLQSRKGGVMAGAAGAVLLSSFSTLMLVSALLGLPGVLAGERSGPAVSRGASTTVTLNPMGTGATSGNSSGGATDASSSAADGVDDSSGGDGATAVPGASPEAASSEEKASDGQSSQAQQAANNPAPEGQSAEAAPAKDNAAQSVALEKKLESADGHLYTVRVTYGPEANVPEGAVLRVVELNQLPDDWDDEAKQANEYKGRPRDTERFLSKDELAQLGDQLAKTLDVGDGAQILWNKYLDVSIVADGQPIVPNANVQVEVETNAVPATASDTLEAALLQGDQSARMTVQNATGTKSGEAEKKAEELQSRVAFTTDRLGEIGLGQVVEKKFSWQMHGDEIAVLGARSVKTNPYEVPLDLEYVDGLRLVEVFDVTVDPTHPFGTTLWIEAKAAADATQRFDGVLCYNLSGDEPKSIFGTEGTMAPVAFTAGDLMALVWDSGMRQTVLDAGDVTLAGEMPVGTTAAAIDVTDVYADARALVPSDEDEQARTVAAYDVSLNVGDVAWNPGEDPVRTRMSDEEIAPSAGDKLYDVVRVGEDGAIPVAAKVEDGSALFDMSEAGSYAIVERTVVEREYEASDGNTYKITVSYDTASSFPRNAALVVNEVVPGSEGYDGYVDGATKELGAEAADVTYAKVLDISIVDPETGQKYQPTKDVDVSIELLDRQPADGTQLGVVHIADDGTAEAVNATSDGNTAKFATRGFSVYAVVQIVKERVLTASDGKAYKVTVTYDDDSGIPEDVELHANEIVPGSEDFDRYLSQAADKLNKDVADIYYSKIFDIYLAAKEDPDTHYQPREKVSVSIELLDAGESVMDTLEVLHITDDGVDVMDAMCNGTTLTFQTESFSIYPIVDGENENARLCYQFWYNDGTQSVLLSTQYFRYKDVHPPESGATPLTISEPSIPGMDNSTWTRIFKGWSKTSYNDEAANLTTVSQLNTELINKPQTDYIEGATPINLFANIENVYYVTYVDINPNNVLATEIIPVTESGTTTFNVKPADQLRPSINPDTVLEGWYDVVNAGTVYEPGQENVAITDSITLYPKVQGGNWLIYDDNDLVDDGSGKQVSGGASFTPPEFYYKSSTIEPAAPTWDGYAFGGWYADPACNTAFTFGQTLEHDTTVYAKWIPSASSYRVIVWKQRASDAVGLVDEDKKYDYIYSDLYNNVVTGQTVTLNNSYTRIYDSAGSSSDKDKWYYVYNENNTNQSVIVKADGSSVLNVYYDRKPITLNFKIYDYRYSVSTNDNDNDPEKYGDVNGKKARVYWKSNAFRTTNYSWGAVYNGTVYTRSKDQSWQLYKTYTGLYGSTLDENECAWPDEYDWYSNGSSTGVTSGTRTTFMASFLPTGNIDTVDFYGSAPSGSGTINFYIENADGNYTLKDTISVSTNSTFTISDKYVGYRAKQYKVDNGSWKNVTPKGSNGYYGNAISYSRLFEIRFARATNTLTFYTNNGSNQLIEKSAVYGSSLSTYADQNPGQKSGYYFLGWYADPACTEEFDFSQTMPDTNMAVYGKWKMMRFRIVIEPGANNVNMGSQALRFRLDYDERISGSLLETATRAGYILNGWYTDPSFTNRFLFSNPVNSSVPGVDMTYQTSTTWAAARAAYGDDDEAHENVRGILHLYAKWILDTDATGINVVYDPGDAAVYDGVGDLLTTVPVDSYMYRLNGIATTREPPSGYNDLYAFKYWEATKTNGDTVHFNSGDPITLEELSFTDPVYNDDNEVIRKTVTLRAAYDQVADASRITHITYDGNTFNDNLYNGTTTEMRGKTRDGTYRVTVTVDEAVNETIELPSADDFYLDGWTLVGWSFNEGTTAEQVNSATNTSPNFTPGQKVAADNLIIDPTNNEANTLYAMWQPKAYSVTVKQVVETGVPVNNFAYAYKIGVENSIAGATENVTSLTGSSSFEETTLTSDNSVSLQYYVRSGHVIRIATPTIPSNATYSVRVNAIVEKDDGTSEILNPTADGDYRIYGNVTIVYTYSQNALVTLKKRDATNHNTVLQNTTFTVTPVEFNSATQQWENVGNSQDVIIDSDTKQQYLQEGTYRIRETTAPEGYAKVSNDLYLTVKKDDPFVLFDASGESIDPNIAELDSNGKILTVYDNPIRTLTLKKLVDNYTTSEKFAFLVTVYKDNDNRLANYDIGAGTTNNVGELEIMLAHDETAELKIPNGYKLIISESANKYTTATSSTAGIQDSDGSNYDQSFTIDSITTNGTVTFTNSRKFADVTITKQMVDTLVTTGTFEFTATLMDDGTDITNRFTSPATLSSFTITANSAVEGHDNTYEGALTYSLPVGAVLTIAEREYSGIYSTSYENKTLKVNEDASKNAIKITNSRKTANVSVTKSLNDPYIASNDSRTFTFGYSYPAHDSNGASINITGSFDIEETNGENKTYVVNDIPVGATVQFTETENENYATSWSNVNGNLIVSDAADQNVITCTNTRKTATLKVSKSLHDTWNPDAEFNFAVSATEDDQALVLSEDNFTLGHDESESIVVPVGASVTVEETAVTEPALDLAWYETKVDGASGTTYTHTVSASEAEIDITTTFTNDRKSVDVTVVKELEQDPINKDFNFDYVLNGGNAVGFIVTANSEAGTQLTSTGKFPVGGSLVINENLTKEQKEFYTTLVTSTAAGGTESNSYRTFTYDNLPYSADGITITYTNTRKLAPVTLNKTLSDPTMADSETTDFGYIVTVEENGSSVEYLPNLKIESVANGKSKSTSFEAPIGMKMTVTELDADLYDVTMTGTAGGACSGAAYTLNKIPLTGDTITIGNVRKTANVTVVKDVENGTSADNDRKFNFTANLSYNGRPIAYGEFNNDGSYTADAFDLTKNGEPKVFEVPIGTTLEVAEDTSVYMAGTSDTMTIADAYTTVAAETTGDAAADHVITDFSNTSSSGSDSSKNVFSITVPTADSRVTVTNTRQYQDVTVNKTLIDGLASSGTFAFNGTLKDDDKALAGSEASSYAVVNGSSGSGTLNSFTVVSGETGTSFSLPVGSVLLVEEGAEATVNSETTSVADNYDVTYSTSTGLPVSKTATSNIITVTNTRKIVDITVSKALDDPLSSGQEDFTFTANLKNTDGVTPASNVLLYDDADDTKDITTDEDGMAEFVLSPTHGGESVKKTLAVPVGVSLSFDEGVKTETIGGVAAQVYTTTVQRILSSGDPDTVQTSNTYSYSSSITSNNNGDTLAFTNARKTTTVTVKKIIPGEDTSKDGDFTFTATLENVAETVKVANYALANSITKADSSAQAVSVVTGSSDADCGLANFTMNHGDSIELTVPVGAKLGITEIGRTVTGGYAADDAVFFASVSNHGTKDTNSHDFAYEGVPEAGDTLLVFNIPSICKVTDASGNLLYRRYSDANYGDVFLPAIYGMIKDAFADANDKKLYASDRLQYALPALQVQMLCDYTIPSSDVVNVNSGSTLTFTTASPSASDGYSFSSSEETRATLTRDTNNLSAFITVNGLAGAKTTFNMSDLVIDGNEVGLASGVNGGVLKAANSDVTIDNCEISNSKADNGGAVYVSGGSLSVTNSSAIKSCEATNGGGIYVESGTLEVTNSTIESCKAITSGGGLFVGSSVTATIQSGTITKNEAQNGGGIYVDGSSTLDEDDRGALTISGGMITENTASSSGSAVYLNDYASASITGGSITANVVNDTVGAVGIAGENARINFSGAPVVYDNTHGDGLQNNVVLSVASDQVINVTGQLADGAKIGVYVTDVANGRHLAGADFGSHNDGITGDFSAFINDRDTALYGMANPDDAGKVCWCYGAVTVSKEWKLLYGYATPPSTVTAEVKRITDLSTVETVATITLNGTESVKLKLLPGYIYVIEEIKVGDTALTSSVYSATYSANSVYVEPGENTNYVITNTNTLVPVQLQKEWDSSVPSDVMAKISEIAFSVTGTSGGGSSPVDCFTGNWPESPKITKLAKASDWQELVYVPKYDASGKPFTSYTIHEETIGEGGTGVWSCSSVYTPKVVSKENWKEDKDSENYQEMYLQFRAQNTEMVADRYKNIHKMDFYFRDAKDGKLYYSSTDFGSDSYNLNRGSLVEAQGNEYFYVRVRVPRNFSPEKAELLASADRSGIQLHQDTTCNYAYGILTYNVQGNKNKPTGAPDFTMRGEGSSRKFDWIAFVDVDSVPEERLTIEGQTRTLMVYVPATLTLTNKFDPIARVRSKGTGEGAKWSDWAYFGALTSVTESGVTTVDGAFNYANTLSGEVEIETLKETDDRYAMTSGFSFDSEGISKLTMRTTQDESWNPLSGEEGHQTRFTSTISRGFTGEDSLISSSVSSLTLDKIMLDGGSEESTTFNCTGNGGLIKVTAGTVNVGSDATLQNSSASNGGAIYLDGGTLNMAGAIDACQANALNTGSGGGIYVNANATLNMDSGTIANCSATNLGGAVFIYGTMNMSGGTITGNSSTHGGAVNFYGPGQNDGVINISGSPTIIGNPSSDASQQKNIDITAMVDTTATNETVLNKIMVGDTLERTADIGVYAPTGNDQEAQFFGKYSTGEQESFYCFRNDKYNYLYGKAGVEGKLQWQKIICKIVDSDNVEHVFPKINAALTHSKDNSNDYIVVDTSSVCTIQMLIDYPLPASDVVELNTTTRDDNIILTTAPKSATFTGEKFFYNGTDDKATITRTSGYDSGSNAKSMFTVKSGANFATQKIILDGGAKFNDALETQSGSITVNYDGGIVSNAGNLDINEGTTLRNVCLGRSKTGGAVNSTGIVSITGTTANHVIITNCVAPNAAAIKTTQTAKLNVSYVDVSNCKTTNINGTICIGTSKSDNKGADAEFTNATFRSCVSVGGTDGDSAGAIYALGYSLILTSCDFDNCSSRSQGGAVYHGKTKNYFKAKYCHFTDCQAGTDAANQPNSGGALETQATDVLVDECTFTHCTSSRNAGAINFYREGNDITPSVKNSTFIGCEAEQNSTNEGDKGSGFGGALRSYGNKTTTIENCTFSGCKATWGGAVSCFSSVDIKGTTFIANCSAKKGGGVYIKSGTLNLNGNTTDASEGRVTDANGVLVTDDNQEPVYMVMNCHAPLGGGIYLGKGTCNLKSGTLYHCYATTSGGGVYLGSDTNNQFFLNGGSITACYAITSGGGVYLGGGKKFEFTSGIISNSCAPKGGGIYIGAALSNPVVISKAGDAITECKARSVTISDAGVPSADNSSVPGQQGGGIYQAGGTLQITNKDAAIHSCEAWDGGGIYLGGGKDTKLELTGQIGSTEKDKENKATNGAGIYQAGGTLTVNKNAKIIGNVATGNGGGVYLAQPSGTTSTLNLKGDIGGLGTDEGNSAVNGGGIYQAGGTLKIENGVSVIGNSAIGGNGGGIYLDQPSGTTSELTLNGGTIKHNNAEANTASGTAVGGNGGGIYLGGGKFTFTEGTIGGAKATEGNTAMNGAGIYQGGGELTIGGGNIKGNEATAETVNSASVGGNGGGIYLGGGTFTMNGGVIGVTNNSETGEVTYAESANGNSAADGAGLYVADGVTSVKILGGKISGNRASGLGGGIMPGGPGAKMYFAGSIQVFDNFLPQIEVEGKMVDVRCDVCLDFDSNDIIHTTDTGLSEESHIGVYVTDKLVFDENNKPVMELDGNPVYDENDNPRQVTLFDKHGKSGKPFGTFDSDKSLSRFINNRRGARYQHYEYYYGIRNAKDTNDKKIYWASYICEITDGTNLLFTNRRGTAPALYQYLGYQGAFDALKNNVKLYTYNPETKVSTEYKGDIVVKMLVNEYELQWAQTVEVPLNNYRMVTLTMCDKDDSAYSGTGAYTGQCVISRGKCNTSMFTTLSDSKFTITNIVIDGGASYTESDGVKTWSDTNKINHDGGLIYAQGNLTLGGNTVLRKSYITDGLSGGAICFYGNGTLTMNNVISSTKTGNKALIQNCKAQYGAALGVTGGEVNFGTTAVPSDGIIQGCEAEKGLLYVSRGTLNLNSTLNGNTDTSDEGRNVIECRSLDGGLAYVGNNGTLNINATIGNFSGASYGGAFFINLGTVNLKSSITDCHATSVGGAAYVKGTLNLTEGTPSITGCSAPKGGAIFAEASDAVIQMSTGEISNNEVTGSGDKYGGAVSIKGASMSISGGAISGNTVTANRNQTAFGAAVHVSVDGQLIITGGTISGNTAEGGSAKGGAISIDGATAQIAGGIISGNEVKGTNDDKYTSGDLKGEYKYGAYGGAVYVQGDADGREGTLILSGGKIIGNTCTGVAKTDGAGIYLAYFAEVKNPDETIKTREKKAKLNISGAPVFGTDVNGSTTETTDDANTVAKSDYAAKKNGDEEVYTGNKVRQDIFIAETGTAPASMVVGEMENVITTAADGTKSGDKDGTIWVWAENSNHYVQGMPFGVFAEGVAYADSPTGSQLDSARLKVFRNARDDDTTDNPLDSDPKWLYGTIEGDVEGFVYWHGVAGNRKVILRKVDSSYAAVKDRKFSVYKGASSTPYTPKGGTPLVDLTSDATGCFWVGDLPIGWYIIEETIEETEPHRYFYVVVTASGTYGTLVDENGTLKDKVGGFDEGELVQAQAAAKALYDLKKDVTS